MACDPVNLGQFVVDLRSRHLSYWNQFIAPDPGAIWSNSTSPVCDICDSDDIQDEKICAVQMFQPPPPGSNPCGRGGDEDALYQWEALSLMHAAERQA
eukprot:1147339-Pelagomonas_calceolata.AAC.3